MSDTDLTGRIGVNLIEGLVLNNLGWVFREQHVSDEGIDAQVETKVQGKTTGRLLAIQVKTGPSYFSEPSDDGWVFRFGERQARLWLDHALPVILVLIDTNDRTAYWQRITSSTVTSTGNRYKVHVPRVNQVQDAREIWEHIASGIESRAVERYDVAVSTIPPNTARLVARLHDSDPESAAVLALHLSEGRRSPASTADSLILAAPHWLQGGEGGGWEALAVYAAAHGALTQSACAFELAAASSDNARGRRLAAAGINAMRDDLHRAAAFLDEATAYPEAELLVRIGRGILAHPQGDAGPRTIEPPLDVSEEAVLSDAFLQRFLCDQSTRAGEVDSAIDHGRRALQLEPDNAEYMIALADALGRRALRATGNRSDLREAASLLTTAVDQIHAWDGPTEEALSDLVRALTLTGDTEGVLKYSLAPPMGIARPEEAERPEVLRHALISAHLLSREGLVAKLAKRLGNSARDQLEKARIGLLDLTDEERIALWIQVADSAEEESDYQEILRAVHHLARLGLDETRRLAPLLERGIVPENAVRLAAALALADTDLDNALPDLRALARSEVSAAEYLVDLLVDAKRFGEASAACRAAHERFHHDYFLILEAQVHIDDMNLEKAEEVATRAVATDGFPRDRARLLTFLATRAGDRGDWQAAEDYLARVLPLHTETRSSDVWRFAIAQLNRGEATRAAETVRSYSPSVRTPAEATLWLRAMASVRWDKAIASEALSLAARFEHDGNISLALLHQIISGTTTEADDTGEDADRGWPGDTERPRDPRPIVPAELHKRAFAAIERHVDRSPESTAVRRLQGTPEELIALISDILRHDRERNEVLRGLLEKVQQGNLPVGLLATGTGKSYALLLIHQATGPLVAAAAQDEEHAADQATAKDALNKDVVIDTSALLLTSQLHRGDALRGHFADLLIPASSRRDILRATVEVRGISARSGTLSWDDHEQRPIYSELTASELLRFQARAESLNAAAGETRTQPVQHTSLFSELADHSLDDSWLDPIRLAHDSPAPLWSDDIGQRRLARSVGVAAFGTPAFIDALNEMAIDRLGHEELDRLQELVTERQEWVRQFVREAVVDVPAHLEDLLVQAESDDWQPLAAATVLTRPSWWVWQASPLNDWSVFVRAARRGREYATPVWQHAAMIGMSRTYVDAEVGAAMLAVLAVIGLGDGAVVDDAIAGFERAREVAKSEGLPDPVAHLPLAVRQLSGHLGIKDPEEFTQSVLQGIAREEEQAPNHRHDGQSK